MADHIVVVGIVVDFKIYTDSHNFIMKFLK